MKKDIEVLEIQGYNEPDESLLGLDKELKQMRKHRLTLKIFIILLVFILLIALLLYGPYKGFKNWLINEASNNNLVSLANVLYGTNEINKVVIKNSVEEPLENTNLDEITFEKQAVDKQILNHDDDYKIIVINENGIKGYLTIIYEPKKIAIETNKKNILNKQVAVNATLSSNNLGLIVKDGKIINNNTRANVGGGIIGFDKAGRLILGKYSPDEVLRLGIQQATDYGPFLIVNGKKTVINGNGGFKQNNKTAIGQRKDGIVLFLNLKNANLTDVLDIMEKYDVVNAANLPGGSDSMLVNNGKTLNSKEVTDVFAFVLND